MVYGAEQGLKYGKYDKETLGFVHDYTEGVNAYINQLTLSIIL